MYILADQFFNTAIGMCVCVCVCVYIYMCIYIYIYEELKFNLCRSMIICSLIIIVTTVSNNAGIY